MRALRVSKTKNCPKAFPFGQNVRQDRIILSVDTASEKYKLLSKKRREYFVYSRAFLQRRWRAAHRAAARRFGAQPTLCGGSWRGDPPERCLSPKGGNCVMLPYSSFFFCQILEWKRRPNSTALKPQSTKIAIQMLTTPRPKPRTKTKLSPTRKTSIDATLMTMG